MAEVWNIPGVIRPGFFPRLGRSIEFLSILALDVVLTTFLAGIGDLRPRTAVVAGAQGGDRPRGQRDALRARVPGAHPQDHQDQLADPRGGPGRRGVDRSCSTPGRSSSATPCDTPTRPTATSGASWACISFLYLAAQITVYAAEVNVVRARHLYPRSIAPPTLTPADRIVLSAIAAQGERRPEQRVQVDFPSTPTRRVTPFAARSASQPIRTRCGPTMRWCHPIPPESRSSPLRPSRRSRTPSSTATGPLASGTAISALRHRTFRIVFFGAFASNIGTWMQNVVLGAYAYDITHSSTFVGVIIFAQLGPALLLAMVGGLIADKVDRKKFLIVLSIEQLVFSLALAWVVRSPSPSHVVLVLMVVMVGVGSAMFGPAYSAILPGLVRRVDLPGAISLNSAQMNASRVIGPIIGGVGVPLRRTVLGLRRERGDVPLRGGRTHGRVPARSRPGRRSTPAGGAS